MSLPSRNEKLEGFTDQDLAREVAIREAIRKEGYKIANQEAITDSLLTTLMELTFHKPRCGCDDHNLIPLGQIQYRDPRGFNAILCPACYLAHLDIALEEDGNFNKVWQDNFLLQLKVVDCPVDARDGRATAMREDHIDMVIEEVESLLPLTFHPNRSKCSDEHLLDRRLQFRRADERMTVACIRCFLNAVVNDPESWDSRYQLRVHFWEQPQVFIPGGC